MDTVPVVKGVPVKDGSSDSIRKREDDNIPEVVDREGPAKIVSNEVEPHVLLSACLLVSSIGCDALTSMDIGVNETDAPTSFRVTSLVLVCILSSPVLKGVNLVDQRVLVGLLLTTFSLVGLHEASEETRTGDCVFIVLVLLATVSIINRGGIENEGIRPDSQHDKPHRKQTVAGLCAALLFYSGLRGLRAAFVSPMVASKYVVEYQTSSGVVIAPGYAHSSTDTTVPLGFCNGVAIATAALIGLHDDARIVGSSAVAFEVGTAGLSILVGATWALLGQAKQFEALQVLYSVGACRGDSSVCYESARARRLSMANNNSGSAWIMGLAMLAFSYAIERRFVSVRTRAESMWAKQGSGISLALLVVTIVGVFTYAEFSGQHWHTDVITLISLVAIFTSSTIDTLMGTILYASVMTYEQMKLLETYGIQYVFVHFTHCTLFISLLLMWSWIGLAILKEIITCFFHLKDNSFVNKGMGFFSAAGASLTFGLYVASGLLLAASNGSLPQEDDVFRGGSPRRSMIAFFLCHFVPFLAWAPLYICRCEINLITNWERTTAWVAALPLDALIYIIVLSSLGQSAPTAVLMQVTGVSVVGLAGFVAWAVAGFV